MPFTREQALAAAGLLALAFDAAAVPPGGTIAQGAAAAAGGAAAALHKGSGGLKKVATAPGSVFYHKPIGALIIPHGKPPGQDLGPHGAPSESPAEEAADAADKAQDAVQAGTHHWVQAGPHTYAVHNSLETHIPKDVDVHDAAAVKNAPKVIVKPHPEPGKGEHVQLHPEHGAGPAFAQHEANAKALETGYKKLPPEPAKKAVTFDGKHAAWVPHDWQVHKDTGIPEAKTGVKYAKDAAGHWHTVSKNGKVQEMPGQNPAMEGFVKSGKIAPDEHPGPEPEHVTPNQAAPGHEPAKVDVGGVAVTKDEIHSAIAHLNEDKSTAVKQPLAKQGHPLAQMDYHGVAQAELQKHPELKIPKGTKKAHVGQVKVAVLHHLAAQAGKLAQDEAQAKAAAEAKAKTEATAVHAQQLSPGTADIGGVTASAEHISAAIGHLTAAKSTAIKQVLKAKGSPLAAADYWQVINDYKAAHQIETKALGTKQAHVPNAKLAFIAALNEHLANLGPEDAGSGHSVAAELDQAVTGGAVKEGWSASADGAVAKALWTAATYKAAAHAYLGAAPGAWDVGFNPPPVGKAYFEATPEHQVTMHLPDGSSHEWDSQHVLDVAKEWMGAAPEAAPAKPEPPKPEPEPAPQPVWDTAAWKQTPEYQTIHALVVNHPAGLPEHGNKMDTNQQLATVLYIAGKLGQKRYLVPGLDGGWVVSSKPPAGIAGTFGIPGKAYYEISPNHEITAFGNDGQPVALPGEQIEQIAQDHLTQPEPEKPVSALAVGGLLPTDFGDFAEWMAYVKQYKVEHPEPALAAVPELPASWLKGDAAQASVQSVTSLSPEAEAALKSYGGVEAYAVNSKLRAGQLGQLNAGQKSIVAKMDSVFGAAGPLKEAVALHRGVGTLGEVPVPGQVLTDKAFLSTSTDSSVAEKELDKQAKNGSGYLLNIVVPAGLKALAVPHFYAEYGPSEKEVLLPRGSRLHVLHVTEAQDGTHVIDAIAMPPEAQPEVHAPEPEKPPEPAPEPDSGTAQLKQLLVNGAVKPSAETGGKTNQDWVLVTTLAKAAKTGGDKWAVKSSGHWTNYTYQPYSGPDEGFEYYHVSGDLSVTHHVDGKAVPVSPEMVSELAQQLVEPDSVKINVGGKHYGDPADWKIFKHGFYYKTSKQAKAYLEISPPQPGSPHPAYIYHAPSGAKTVNASYAAKVLTDATEYHAQPKGTVPSTKKIAYATTFKPVSYYLWSDITKSPSHDHVAQFHEDGSVLLTNPGGSAPLSAESAPEVALLKGGVVLDGFGTTVVKPGVVPDAYHVFGSEAKTPADLQNALDQLQAAYTDKSALADVMKTMLVPDVAHQQLAYSFFSAKVPQADWHGQRDAVMGLLRELLQVPQNKPGSETAAPAGEIKFLKGLPPGIASAKDVFTWTDQGYAKPAEVDWPPYPIASLPATAMGDFIKQISAQFGDGKVVGTHPSALAKDAKLDWLQSWQAGDMAKVFAYDATGGKVSPAHPGAPDNTSTHQISWAPWDVSQVPASQQIEGDWSAEGVLPTQAEVSNYLIKAGLQHAAFLEKFQRRAWMQAHQAHDQFTVDKLSKQAEQAFSSGAQPKSEPPTFTENLVPAKPWDAYLDEKTPAQHWPAAALDAFLTDHKDDLAPFVQQAGTSYGYGLNEYSVDDLMKPSFYAGAQIKKQASQLYLDDLAAKETAEKLKPRYHLAEPGTAEDQFGRQYEWITGTSAQLASRAAVAALARAWGFRTPQITTVALEDGTAGAVTPLLEDTGTLAGMTHQGMKALTGRELGDIAREHVLDYALANPGSTPGSYLRLADGSVTGADKVAALSDLGWDGTDPVQMNAHTTQPVSLIFDAIAQGWLPQEQADAAYIAAARAAGRMAAMPDSRLQALLGPGLAAHTAAQLLKRKNALPDQIKALWDGIYTHQGWTPPEVPAAKITRGLHSGFTEPEFMDHVAAAKSFGVPAFFNEPGLADGHVLVWTELDPKGQRLVRGEASIRKIASDKVTGWVKAHSGDAASMVPQGEVGFNLAIQHAALYIDKHNMVMKNYDYTGPETAKAMAEMAAAKSQLISQLASAQHALAAGPASADYAATAKAYGDPASVVSMAQHYLAQIDTAEQAKAAGVGTPLSPEQFPGWKAVEQSHLGGGVKITYKKATRQLGTDAGDVTADTWSLGKDDGELHLAAGKSASYPGYVWQVELPTGEVIEINDAGETQTPKAHHGMIRFTSVTKDGPASLERIRGFLQQAGLGMEEAGQADMENQYWRTMAWVLSDRADRKEPKHMKVWDEIAQGLYGKSAFDAIGPGKEASHVGELTAQVMSKNLAPEEEAALWRTAWAHLTSPEQIQQWVDNEGYLPHLAHHDIHAPEVPGGKPDWYRFDVSPGQVAAQQMLTESLYSPEKDAVLVARSGGLFSSDARLRALGTYKTGMSWGSDMSHGASGMVFTRQNQQSDSGMSVWISPRVLARAQTYSFPSDHYGEIDDRRTSAYFDFAKASAMSGGTNETLVLDGISLLDDIEVIKAYTETQRQQIVADLKSAGITEIRGLPVEDRIVTASGVSAAVQKAIAAAQSDGWFTQPENPYVPSPSALSGAPAAEKKFVSQVTAQEKAMDAQQGAAQAAQQLGNLAKQAWDQAGEVPFSYAQ